jgi:hypothetical protein
MRLGRRLVLLAAVTTALSSPFAAIAATSPAASAAVQGNVGWVRCANLSQGASEDVYLYSFGNPGKPIVLMHQGYGGVASYMPVSAGEYTVAVRPVGAVLQDRIAGLSGKALVRVIQASSKQLRVTVSVGTDTLARQLASGSVTTYQAVQPGTPTVVFSTPDGHAAMPVTLAAGSVHTIVVLDGTSGLKIDNLTDAAASQAAATGGAATGLGGTAPGLPAPGLAPWLGTLAAGLLLAVAGGFGLRRSRRTDTVAGG